ncbi:uncharacterized protein LOC130375751 [Gadus chalcogrammus]|uniref:uncharacterized protein LOC130375751 n=1 Tax=Gadus chalcogrammus TaxID=1042646 RepID=UPI0024C317E9|nr:uncharacterized protein LOC130375751 [Gadus chalcogrammus]
MATSNKLDSGSSTGAEDMSLDREQTKKRRSGLRSYVVTLSFVLLCILVTSVRYDSVTPRKGGREHLMNELVDWTRIGWIYFHKSFYLISTTKRSWTASRDYCLQRNADLVVINSRKEQEFVSRFKGRSWIGLSKKDTNGNFKWVDDTNMTSSWVRNKTHLDAPAKDCVEWGTSLSEGPCDQLQHWVCERVIDLDHLEAELNKEAMPRTAEAPIIAEFRSSSKVLPVGQAARFSCDAGGTPDPTIQWLHNGRPLERDGTDDQSEAWVERGFLFVRGVSSGVTTVCCMASNSAGTANHTAELLVFDACELPLDPNTAHKDLSLSEDNRTVKRVGGNQSYPDLQERFDTLPQVLCREGLTGCCYWEVERNGSVGIGVTYRGITRKGGGNDSKLGGNNKSWLLDCLDDRYTARYNGSSTDIVLDPSDSNRVGVYLDRPAGSLSFFRVSPDVRGLDILTHIHTFHSTFTKEDLLPGFRLGDVDAAVSLL